MSQSHTGQEGSPARQGGTAAQSPALADPPQPVPAGGRDLEWGLEAPGPADEEHRQAGGSLRTIQTDTECDLENYGSEEENSSGSGRLFSLAVDIALAELISFPEFFSLIFQAF